MLFMGSLDLNLAAAVAAAIAIVALLVLVAAAAAAAAAAAIAAVDLRHSGFKNGKREGVGGGRSASPLSRWEDLDVAPLCLAIVA